MVLCEIIDKSKQTNMLIRNKLLYISFKYLLLQHIEFL